MLEDTETVGKAILSAIGMALIFILMVIGLLTVIEDAGCREKCCPCENENETR